MAAPRQLLLRLWGVGTLGLVLAIATGAYLWEQQLPERLQSALDANDYEACIRTSEQLASLRWLGEGAPEGQALCRQKHAEDLWDQGDPIAALTLQQQLVASGHGDLDLHRKTLERWRQVLIDQAIALFREGDLQQALELLNPLKAPARSSISQLSATLMEIWNRNQLEERRLVQLVEQERWWEALDSLNKLDHPWWQEQASATRQQVVSAIQALGEAKQHQQHPAVYADVISGDRLNAAVEDQLVQGLDPWSAFSMGCSHLGGHVEEDGPESFCRRSSPSP
ncbi:hypothetical protein FZX09_08005 [Synechococcus sp. MU1643]|uniref:hypothetical protein n=1 Tax=Synechococcus sp. MU1643 TaxID=2508349 RepID=UPI001CF923CF|nr:hypothetical protein [Synechococcus sp. MU1643]